AAVLLLEVKLSTIAPVPAAVLDVPLLRSSDPAQTAVLKQPSVSCHCEYHPSPVLNPPLVRFLRALNPSLVLPPPRSPSAACVCGENAKEAITSRMRNERHGDGPWLIAFLRLPLQYGTI